MNDKIETPNELEAKSEDYTQGYVDFMFELCKLVEKYNCKYKGHYRDEFVDLCGDKNTVKLTFM